MMQKTTRYFVSLALCLSLSLITTPSPTTAIIVPLPHLLPIALVALTQATVVGLALTSAFAIGAALGQASRGKCLQTNLKIHYNVFLYSISNVVKITINSQFSSKGGRAGSKGGRAGARQKQRRSPS